MEQWPLKFAGVTIHRLDGMADYRNLEGWGVNLASTMSALLRTSLGDEAVGQLLAWSARRPRPHGPDFHYDSCPNLFLGRHGYGPLYVALDTNLLIDYFQFGWELWSGNELPASIGEKYAAELEGLQLVVALWVLRDIRFVILPGSLSDGTRKPDRQRAETWKKAFEEFVCAIQLVSFGEPDSDAPSQRVPLKLPDSEIDRLTGPVPKGFDRALVRTAARAGYHVFLTRDKGILRARESVRSTGLLLMSPLDLVEQLVACGAFHCLLHPAYAFWPLPDQQRVAHVINALPDGQLRSTIQRHR